MAFVILYVVLMSRCFGDLHTRPYINPKPEGTTYVCLSSEYTGHVVLLATVGLNMPNIKRNEKYARQNDIEFSCTPENDMAELSHYTIHM